MSDGGDFDGGSFDIEVGDVGGDELNTNYQPSSPRKTQFFISCFLLIFFIALDVMINIIFIASIRKEESNPIFILFVEFSGASILYALPSVIIGFFPEGKPRFIYAIICTVINVGGIILIFIGVVCCFIFMEISANAIPICMISIFNGIILLVRYGLTHYNFLSTKGYNRGYSSYENNQNNNEEQEVDMRDVQHQENN